MFLALLAIAFIVMPLLELYVIVQVGQAIGAWNTIGILVLVALVGVWLTKHEGFYVLRRMRQQLDAGQVPTDELIDGCLVLAGGLLLILPGFISDAIGLIVLFPPTRALVRNVVKRRFRIVTVRRYNGRPYDDGPGGPSSGPPVIDV
jgi:UPF0716 protein FxsA